MTWCLWSCPEPEQSWAFPKRLGLFQQGLITIYYHFQKLIESPTTVRQKEERDILGPWDNLEGKSCLAGSFLISWPCPQDNLEGKSCLAGSFLIPAAPEGTYWAPGAAPCEKELPCRFLSRSMALSWTGCVPVTPDSIDLNAAHILLTKADLPSLPHQSAYTPHTRLFVSSERKILHFQLLYSSCCDFIRHCFLNPWVEMGANSSLRRCKGRRGQKRQKTAEKREVRQELSQDMKRLGPSSL